MLALLIGALLLGVHSTAEAPHPALEKGPQFSIPFEVDHGHIFVSAFVNGAGPYRFGFDTGASGLGRVDRRLTSSLSLPAIGEAVTSDGVRTATAETVQVKDLRLGKLERRDIALISRDYNKGRPSDAQPIMGIIARDFFADELVTIDYPRRTITFSDAKLDSKKRDAVAYGTGFTISVCFASGCYPAKVDTGSSRGIVVPMDLVGKIAATPPVLIGQGLRTNGVSNLYEMQLNEPVRIAGLTVSPRKILYADPSDDVINVGTDFLKDYILTIDQRSHLLRISAPSRR